MGDRSYVNLVSGTMKWRYSERWLVVFILYTRAIVVRAHFLTALSSISVVTTCKWWWYAWWSSSFTYTFPSNGWSDFCNWGGPFIQESVTYLWSSRSPKEKWFTTWDKFVMCCAMTWPYELLWMTNFPGASSIIRWPEIWHPGCKVMLVGARLSDTSSFHSDSSSLLTTRSFATVK